MKFTKEDACKELVKRMTTKGETLNLSERSINAQVETLLSLIATEEMEMDDFVGKILPLVQTADANIRKDVSDGIREYKAAHPQQQTPPPPSTPPTPDDKTAALLARLEALENKNKEAELALKHQGLRSDLKAKMKELGVKNEKWIDTMLPNIAVAENMDVEGKAKEMLELYNAIIADVDPSITPATPKGTHTYIEDSIKAAAALAKQSSLYGNEKS